MGLYDKVEANASGTVEFTCPLSKDNYYFAVRAVLRTDIRAFRVSHGSDLFVIFVS
jgi:hypothetical protein